MGISRDSRHKRRKTGGRRNVHQKKRKSELGRASAMTKIGEKRVHTVRVRGGHTKFRALRLDTGNFSWGTEVCTRKARIMDVMYNASNNELVRTKTLVKGCIVQVDATPFRQYYEQHYAVTMSKKGSPDKAVTTDKSKKAQKKFAKRQEGSELDQKLNEQINYGRMLARVSSRPGQCGRCDGYILEGKELEFYTKKLHKK